MMYSGKPPLKTYAHGFLPKDSAATAARKEPPVASENCDPNVSLDGGGAPRKGEWSPGLKGDLKSTSHGSISHLPKAEPGGTREGDGESDRCVEETSRSAKSRSPSPVKVAPSPHQQQSHGHRHHHVCRSPRCASNNPDYAVPAQSTPRKYLISKRHLLAGAICTRDPTSLANHTQDSLTSPSEPSSAKPPKPTRKLENAFRQPSFSGVSNVANASPPSRIPKPPAHALSSPVEPLPSSSLLSPPARVPASLKPLQLCTSEESPRVDETPQARCVELESTTGLVEAVDSAVSCTYTVPPSSSLACNASEKSEDVVESNKFETTVTAPMPADPELSSLEKLFLPTFIPSRHSGEFVHSSSQSEHSSLAGPASPVRPTADLEYVTEKLAQNLAFEKAEDMAQEIAECNSGEGGSNVDHVHFDEAVSNSPSEDCSVYGKASMENQYSDKNGDEEANQVEVVAPALILEETEEQKHPHHGSIDNFTKNYESAQNRGCEDIMQSGNDVPEWQRGVPKYVRGKGRQLWRSDCRDSREVVFLKQTSPRDRPAGDWMVDNILEGAISKLNPSGKGRVRVLVEAFESLMNLGETDTSERRASRVWCLNRMEKGEVDEDGDEFEDGDQRVDCYEVSGEGLQLRASMRLSLGGGTRQALCSPDDASEIEISAIEKVQDWDDDCHRSISSQQNFDNDQDHGCVRSPSAFDGVVDPDDSREDDESGDPELTVDEFEERVSIARVPEPQVLMNENENERLSEDFNCGGRTVRHFDCSPGDNVQQRIEDLDVEYKVKSSRHRRFWKASSVKSEPDLPCSSHCGSAEKDQRVIRGTLLEPFHLRTEERGTIKEYHFAKKLENMFAEEERLRNPIAQGLPWTTDEPQILLKPPVKEQTRPVEFRHYSTSRAIERAEFDNYVAERGSYVEMQRQEEERLRQIAEQEEVKRLRREMVPRAQLMPFFNQPFMPTRSSKRLTVPKEPSFRSRQHKRAKCLVWQEQHHH